MKTPLFAIFLLVWCGLFVSPVAKADNFPQLCPPGLFAFGTGATNGAYTAEVCYFGGEADVFILGPLGPEEFALKSNLAPDSFPEFFLNSRGQLAARADHGGDEYIFYAGYGGTFGALWDNSAQGWTDTPPPGCGLGLHIDNAYLEGLSASGLISMAVTYECPLGSTNFVPVTYTFPFGSSVPVHIPEPSSLLLLVTGIVAFRWFSTCPLVRRGSMVGKTEGIRERT